MNNQQPFYPSPSTTETPIPPPPLEQDAIAFEKSTPNRGVEWAWVIAAAVLLGSVLLVGAIVVLTFDAQPDTISGELEVSSLPTPVDVRVDYSGRAPLVTGRLALTDGTTLELHAWDGQSRLTLLVMGIDRRPGETGLAYRTDTMMLVSFDPQTDSVGILSIPRDLWVDVPGYSALQRVNVPMVLGELQCAGCGADLAMQTVQYNLGMRVHGYLVVDFEAFITLIDAMGGITLDVPTPIYDYEYPSMNYGYDPFIIQAGVQQLDGETALKYARTRHGDSDFDRAHRQQRVIMAVREQMLEGDTLFRLIAQSPALLGGLSQDVATSLSVEDAVSLALYLRDLPLENIRTGVIDSNYVTDYTTEDGSAVLIPVRERLADLLIDVFGASYAG